MDLIYTIGVVAGAISTLLVGEKIGRKRSVILGATCSALACVLQTSSFGLPQLIVGRLLAGIGSGFVTSSAPVWQVETSQAKLRGRLVLIQVAMENLGSALASWIMIGFDDTSGAASWRAPLALQLIFIGTLFFVLPFVPESPRSALAFGL